MEHRTVRKSFIAVLLPSLGAAVLLLSVPAAALVGGAPEADQSIARSVVMVVGSDKTFAAGSQVIVAGYGVTVIGNSRTGGTLRAAHLVVTRKPGTLQIRLADPNTKGELAGLGACQGDSGGPVLDTSDGRLAVIGMISWATGPALSEGCGGLTGVTPITRYRDWIVNTAAAMGSAVRPMAPPEPSPKPAPAFGQEGLDKKQFTRVVASGTNQRIGFYTWLNPDCTVSPNNRNTAAPRLQLQSISPATQKNTAAPSAMTMRFVECKSIISRRRNTSATMHSTYSSSSPLALPGKFITT